MAKNEAKIKFTAETSEFNDSIKKSNNELSELRAELKLNEAQMKTAGASVDGLKKKHSILESQLKASQDKTEALTQKTEAAVRIFGETSDEASRLRTQLANAQTAEEKIRKAISDCNKELEEQERAAADAAKAHADAAAEAEAAARAQKEAERATNKLNSTIAEQQSELDQLKGKYTDAVLQYGKGSKEAKDLAKQIDKLSSELADNQKALGKAEAAADKLDNSFDKAGDAARESADGFTVAKGVIADLASNAIQAAIGKVSEFVGYLAELPEATREIRQDMATLETSFETAGLTSEQATGTWKELYKVFGEDDRAVEAANLISKMSSNQKDLNSWVNITKGVWGSYQDSLPVEGLAEASNETAKTGKVTGVLADALNWSGEAASMFSKYMSEDVTTAEDAFNEALKECTTEQERQTLITETLTSLYGDAAKKYDEASGAQTKAKEAAADNILVQNELAETLEPVTTAWQGMKNELLQGVAPAIQSVAGWLKEHPAALKAIAVAVTAISVALGVLAIGAGAYAVSQWVMNSAMLACPLTWIVAAIAALIAIVVVIIAYWDELKAVFVGAWEAIKQAWSACVEFFKGVWDGVKNAASGVWDGVKSAAVGAWEWIKGAWSACVDFFKGLWDGVKSACTAAWDFIKNVVSVAIQLIGSIISAAVNIITLPFRFIWENCKQYVIAAWNGIKSAVSTAINAVKNTITKVMNAIKSFLSPILNAIKNAFTTAWNAIKSVVTTAVNAVKSVVTSVWNGIKSVVTSIMNAIKSVVTTAWNAVKTTVTRILNGIKSTVSSVWNGIKSTISSVVNGIKSTVSSGFNAVKSTATSVFNGVKNAIMKPINAARDGVKSALDKIKGYFSGLKLKFPNIKLPHFKISGKFSLDPPSVPKLKIDWYSKAMSSPMILNSATIFGHANGKLLGGGESGSEMIGGTNTVMRMIQSAVDRSMQAMNISALAAAVEDLADRPIEMNINGRRFAVATASDTDSVGGMRNSFKSRGLALD